MTVITRLKLSGICSTNREVTGGRITSTPQAIYRENDTITIECDEDYQLNPHLKNNVLVCEANGQWSFNNFTKICTKSKLILLLDRPRLNITIACTSLQIFSTISIDCR